MQGEMIRETGAAAKGAVHVIRQLGLVGLYKGAGACALRDVPFSMIYVSVEIGSFFWGAFLKLN